MSHWTSVALPLSCWWVLQARHQMGQQHVKDRGKAVLPSWFVSISMPHVNHWQSLTPGHGTQMLVAHWDLSMWSSSTA